MSRRAKDPETMRIRACSRLVNFVTDSAKDLFREFRRLGVYAWSDVRKTANDDPEGRIMAMKFDDTERFPHPPKWDDFQEILIQHGVRTNLQSPIGILESAFVELYRRGFAIEDR